MNARVEGEDKTASQLATATAAGKMVPLHDGSEVHVKPLMFMQTVRTLQLLPPLLETLKVLRDEKEGEVIGLTDLLTQAPDALIKVAGMCTGKEPEFFETLETDDGLDVFTAVWEVNQDFFATKVLPRLQHLGLDGALANIRRLGSNALTSSSKVDTPSAT